VLQSSLVKFLIEAKIVEWPAASFAARAIVFSFVAVEKEASDQRSPTSVSEIYDDRDPAV
jgi:hypothetical protein